MAAAALGSLILAALAEGGPLDQQDPLIRTAGARSTARPALARLAERFLVERRERPTDRRRIDVSITPAALRASDPGAPDELQTLRSILGKVAGRTAAPGRPARRDASSGGTPKTGGSPKTGKSPKA